VFWGLSWTVRFRVTIARRRKPLTLSIMMVSLRVLKNRIVLVHTTINPRTYPTCPVNMARTSLHGTPHPPHAGAHLTQQAQGPDAARPASEPHGASEKVVATRTFVERRAALVPSRPTGDNGASMMFAADLIPQSREGFYVNIVPKGQSLNTILVCSGASLSMSSSIGLLLTPGRS
jgi:hypothetical protein